MIINNLLYIMVFLTSFKKVNNFNIVGGNVVNTKPYTKLFEDEQSTKIVSQRLQLILEEANEVKEAVRDKSFVDLTKELCDLLVVTYGLLGYMGVDADLVMDKIYVSNMSKFIPIHNEQLAKESCQMILQEGRYDSPAYKVSPCGNYYICYNKSTNKILKGNLYKPVDLWHYFL